jgi:uncharacterized protein (TIGR02117 family)
MYRQTMLLGLCVLLIPWGCSAPRPSAPKMLAGDASVYVVSHGWHTSLVVQRDAIPVHLWPEHRELPASKYLEIGWGDQAFYQADNVTLGLLLKAALVATPSVLHLVWFDLPVAAYFPASDLIEVRLSQSDFGALCTFIHQTYETDAAGQPIYLGPGLYGQSAFYRAKGKYHFFNTCNNWTAKALRAAGCPIAPGQAMTADNVMSQTRTFGNIIRLESPSQSQLEGTTWP